MKKYSFILLVVVTLSIVFFACNNEIEDNLLSETTELVEMENMPQIVEFENYSVSLGKFLSEVQKINSTKDLHQVKELVNLYALAEYYPEEYQGALENMFYSIYTKDEINQLSSLYEIVAKRQKDFLQSPIYKNLTESDLISLNKSLVFEIPQLKGNNHLNTLYVAKTRNESNNGNACISACESAYYNTIIQIAQEYLCRTGASIVVTCATLGTMSIPSLIAAIISSGLAYEAYNTAEKNYNECLRNCPKNE